MKMATLAAVGEQMGCSNVSKQPGPGPESGPDGPLALEWVQDPRARSGTLCPGMRSGAPVSLRLGLSFPSKVEARGQCLAPPG